VDSKDFLVGGTPVTSLETNQLEVAAQLLVLIYGWRIEHVNKARLVHDDILLAVLFLCFLLCHAHSSDRGMGEDHCWHVFVQHLESSLSVEKTF
jgi:hypothetical protein